MTTNSQPIMGKKQLLKSLIFAFIIGAIVLVTAVFPAEYGMDPLGTGKLFGFNKLYQGESTEAIDAESSGIELRKLTLERLGSPKETKTPEAVNNPVTDTQFQIREDIITVVVPAKKGIEYKIYGLKYGNVKYDWVTDKSIVYTDFHGEIINDKSGFYESYLHAYSNNMAGTVTLPFEGKHGWYYRNETNEDITITLRLKGEYELFDRKQMVSK